MEKCPAILRYEVIRAFYQNPDHGEYIGYGLCVFEKEKPVLKIEDITDREEALSRLAKECTRLQLAPSHLPGIVEDFLLEIHK